MICGLCGYRKIIINRVLALLTPQQIPNSYHIILFHPFIVTFNAVDQNKHV